MVARPKKVREIPKTIGACADVLYTTRMERLTVNRTANEMEEYEKAIKEHLIKTVSKKDSKGAIGKVAKAVIDTADVPVVHDWEAFYKYIWKTKSFHLLQRRLSEDAIAEIWAAGKQVPGVKAFTVTKVSVTKL